MRFLICLGVLCTVFSSQGQVCEGNTGENLFLDGDFGSGSENNIPFDPGIAPGYLYQLNPPPNDGAYIITNDIGEWFTDFGWMNIGDNSGDPNGYMMVVNASFDPGLFYQQTISGLCENTDYEFSADIINLHRPGTNIILPNVSFLIDGEIQVSTGNIEETGNWRTYGFGFSTEAGQTEVTLALQNNAPGGIGNGPAPAYALLCDERHLE